MAQRPIRADELVDRCFSRPVATAIVAAVRPTKVTPNMLTFAAACAGVGTGLCLGLQRGPAAAAFMAVYLALDCSDGQLARIRGGGGVMGRIIDGVGDYITALAVHLGLMIWIGDTSPQGFLVAVPCAVGAAFSMGWNSMLLDRYKRRYQGTVDDLDAIDSAYAAARWYQRLMIRTYRPYAERMDDGIVVPDLDAYQQRVRVPMILWLWVGPTTHMSAIAICAFLGVPLLYAFMACLPFNALALFTLFLQRRLERRAPAVVEDRLAA